VSRAWGTCVKCGEYTLHYIRTVRKFQDVTRPQLEHVMVNAFEDPEFKMRWIPGKRTTGRKMLRECRDCGKTWWEILEQKTEDA
jgi:hypothetical protein